MSKLEDLKPDATVREVLTDTTVTVVSVKWCGTDVIELTYKTPDGKVGNQLLYREDEARLEVIAPEHTWSFDADGRLFRLAAEAQRIRFAYLYDPLLAVHTSILEPLPHQIIAVYDIMLRRQPLRFLLADDPGAGKTIMAGLLIKELIARGDLHRCLIVCPGGLVEKWQDELYQRFHLPFEILTNDKLEAAHSGNWFLENNLVIARLDKLSRDENVQAKLKVPDCRWDLIVCDEAHKMSASYFGGEIKRTKRYRLGELLGTITRHFLLITATPHNGKEEDFQLFLALLDPDRFEGRTRDSTVRVDVSDIMRRMVKEHLVKFDGTPLFPERYAYTVPYRLSQAETRLYSEVTQYVCEEFNRADQLPNKERAGTVGFALTILQRRLASSPEAIYQSLRRRRERLEARLREAQAPKRDAAFAPTMPTLSTEDLEDLEDASSTELEEQEEAIVDEATAARTIEELAHEIDTLRRLEKLAEEVRRSGVDTKWRELSQVLNEMFSPALRAAEPQVPYGAGPAPPPKFSPHEKLIIFTEHRDTLNYLYQRVSTLLGRPNAILCIHGGMGREERTKQRERFVNDPTVRVLIATDAAGEGIDLQRARLLINYDLPWNPNRIEQRFGRIHRIGQTEVCYMWNLVAEDTREGDVYRTLLNKLEEARQALGGKVFDVLGQLQFEGKPLRDLLIEAIRYGERPEVRARLSQVIANAVNSAQLTQLIEEQALTHEVLSDARLRRVREDMERADARRLQPHFIESFFLEAFKELGGSCYERERRRYELTHVPPCIRERDRQISSGEHVLRSYERVVFEKDLIAPHGLPRAAFLCPGHPLLNATIDLILQRYGHLLRRGTILVDEQDPGMQPRLLVCLEHAIQDGTRTPSGDRRIISKRHIFLEVTPDGSVRHCLHAPYLDYRPLSPEELGTDPHHPGILPALHDFLRSQLTWHPELDPTSPQFENFITTYAAVHLVPEHLREVRSFRLELIRKTEQAVKERLLAQISYWDSRANELADAERAGKPNAKLNSLEARRRANELQERYNRRLDQLNREKDITPLPPLLLSASLILPLGLVRALQQGLPAHQLLASAEDATRDKLAAAAVARQIVIDYERSLGFEPIDRELEHVGYDIESRVPATGKLRFIEVKACAHDATTVTVTKNEILCSLNKPDDYILAIVKFGNANAPAPADVHTDSPQKPPYALYYIRRPFRREPDFAVTCVTYSLNELLKQAELIRST